MPRQVACGDGAAFTVTRRGNRRAPTSPRGQHTRSADDGDPGKTLAALVRETCPDVSWSRARELCRTGRVRVDNEVVFDSARRMQSDVTVRIEEAAPRRECPVLERERIVFDDGGLLVVDKPFGLVTNSADERVEPDSLTGRLRLALRSAGRHSLEPHPLFHLDPDLTGLVAFATDRPARRALEQQFRDRTPLRRYTVLVWGQADARKIDLPLLATDDGRRRVWRGEGRPPKTARLATTFVRVESSFDHATLLTCECEGLRRDQLQVHLATTGTPVIGDRRYGRPALDGPLAELEARQSQPLIHGSFLALLHPRHKRHVHLTCDVPAGFRETIEALARMR